jgi:hypothetical protein
MNEHIKRLQTSAAFTAFDEDPGDAAFRQYAPFINLMNAQSPQVNQDPANERRVPGAYVGCFIIPTVGGEVRVATEFVFQPLYFVTDYIEFFPQGSKEPPIHHGWQMPPDCVWKDAKKGEAPKSGLYRKSNGNFVREDLLMFAMVGGMVAVFSWHGTALKEAKGFADRANATTATVTIDGVAKTVTSPVLGLWKMTVVNKEESGRTWKRAVPVERRRHGEPGGPSLDQCRAGQDERIALQARLPRPETQALQSARPFLCDDGPPPPLPPASTAVVIEAEPPPPDDDPNMRPEHYPDDDEGAA